MVTILVFILKVTPPQVSGLTTRQKLARLDVLGELFLFPSIICLLLAMQWGGSTYAWSNPRIIALFVLFGVLLIAFILVQIFRQESATIPKSVITNRSIIAAMWFAATLGSAMMLFVYYLPIWFQAIKGDSAVKSGIHTLPMVLALVVGSIGAGRSVAAVGYYTPFAIACAVVMPIGAGLFVTFTTTTKASMWIGTQIIFGLGLGLGMQQTNLAAQTVLRRADVPTGIALVMFCNKMGGAIFVSVGQNLLNSNLVKLLPEAVPTLNTTTIINTGATELRKIVPVEQLPKLLLAYNAAIRQVFICGTILTCLTVIGAAGLEWRSVKGKQGPVVKPIASEEKAGEKV